MRILYCNKYNFRFSGTEAYLFETMELMRSRGHEAALFSMADDRGAATPYDHHFVPLTDFKQSVGFVRKAQLAFQALYSLEARKRIGRMIDDFRPDVAHVRNIYHHLSPSILWELKSRGVPVLYHINDFKLICPNYNLISSAGDVCERCKGGRFWNVVSQGCYSGGFPASTVLAAEAYFHTWISTYPKCVDLILAPSRFAKQKLIENGNGWQAERIEVLPHFQNCPTQVVPHPGSDAPVLYFGRLSAEKGVDDLLHAMQRVPNIQLIIAGDGPQRPLLEALGRSLGLTNVRFVGHLSGAALESAIAGSQFTVFPSRAYETMGKSILESYAQARAVVASDLGSRRELVADGRTGVLYKVKDIAQLSSAIALLDANPDLAEKMGGEGYELVKRKHSQERHFAELERIYERLASWQKSLIPKSFPHPKTGPGESRHLRVAFIGGRGVVGKYSGIETCYEEMGTRLVEMDHEVTAYCRSYFTPKASHYRGIRILRLPTIRTKHLETLIHTFLSTIHACFSSCNVVHYYTLGPSLFSFLPRIFGKKTVVSVQGLDWQRKKWGNFAQRALRFCEWTSARLPNATVVVSRTLQEYCRSRYRKECVYVPNGTRIRERRTSDYLRRNGLEADGYALFLGRFSPEKNCDLLIKAFERLDTNMKLVLAGGSSHTDDYVADLRKHESQKVKILDWISGDDLEEVLTNAALFVLPSDMEGLSLALLDAMSAGVCALASDTPENVETLGDAGFTFRRGDVNDLQRLLTLLLADPVLRENVGRRGQARVRREYLWKEVAKATEAIYLTLVKAPQKRSAAEQKTARIAA
jgi:glycosyltransferase involved in cell wall biosynthesis